MVGREDIVVVVDSWVVVVVETAVLAVIQG